MVLSSKTDDYNSLRQFLWNLAFEKKMVTINFQSIHKQNWGFLRSTTWKALWCMITQINVMRQSFPSSSIFFQPFGNVSRTSGTMHCRIIVRTTHKTETNDNSHVERNENNYLFVFNFNLLSNAFVRLTVALNQNKRILTAHTTSFTRYMYTVDAIYNVRTFFRIV